MFKVLRRINSVDANQGFHEIREDARPLGSNIVMGEEGEERRENVLEVERCNLEV